MAIDPISCGVFLLAAFTLTGIAQTAWFVAPASRVFALPLDGGLCLRGRRLFGANKTIRGFVVFVPAAAGAFALLGALAPASLGIWDLPVHRFAALGAVAGFGFMAGELPNSFLKRQLDIPPGAAPFRRIATFVQFAADRFDSGIGMLVAAAFVVPVPWETWAVVLIVGPSIHWSFSLVMFRLGLKARAA